MTITGQHMKCKHVPAAPRKPAASACQTCGLSGPIRVCLTCGYVGCCESAGAHDTAHFQDTGHSIIRSLPLTPSSFTWCYLCKAYVG